MNVQELANLRRQREEELANRMNQIITEFAEEGATVTAFHYRLDNISTFTKSGYVVSDVHIEVRL